MIGYPKLTSILLSKPVGGGSSASAASSAEHSVRSPCFASGDENVMRWHCVQPFGCHAYLKVRPAPSARQVSSPVISESRWPAAAMEEGRNQTNESVRIVSAMDRRTDSVS
jgi:hypothetical protein